MKRHSLKIWITMLAACALFMAVNAVIGRAAPTVPAGLPKYYYCQPTFQSLKTGEWITPLYNDYNKGTEEMMEDYHKKINEAFNGFIYKMITEETAAAASNTVAPLGQPPEPVSDTDPSLKACPDGNYSTYCVGMMLLNNETWGYLAYRRALECRRTSIFESSQEEDTWNKWIKTTTCLGGEQDSGGQKTCTPEQEAQLEKDITDRYQGQKALMISARLEAITREKSAAKQALDQTLSAYNELRTAWPMHKKYMEIYESLTTYRDKMVEIRKQVEEFPSKFIDATTTKCT